VRNPEHGRFDDAGNPKPVGISSTVPLRSLLGRIGKVTYELNTIAVGLTCVAEGKGKKGAIALNWDPPPDPERRKLLVDGALSLACSSVLVFSADIFDAYLRELANLPWLELPEETRAIVGKSKTRAKAEGGSYSTSERFDSLAAQFGFSQPSRMAAFELMVKWRNAIAHRTERPVTFTRERETQLLKLGSDKTTCRSQTEIEETLRDFMSRRPPKPNQVVLLVSNAVRLSRALDVLAIEQSTSTDQKMCAVADCILRSHFNLETREKRNRIKKLHRLFALGEKSRMAVYLQILEIGGISRVPGAASPPLSRLYLKSLASTSQSDFVRRFSIDV